MLTLLSLSAAILAQAPTPPAIRLPQPSPGATVTQTIGTTAVTIEYSRPGVKGRKIWGELVPFGQVWRTGANMATTISFSDPVKIAGKDVPKGKYAFFAIPTATKWTLILSTKPTQSGSSQYKESEDLMRFEVTPKESANTVEWLSYSIDPETPTSGLVTLAWDKLAVPFKVEVNVPEIVGKQIAEAVSKAEPTDWAIYNQAARFYADAGADLPKATEMIKKSLSIKETYQNLVTQADILKKTGKSDESLKSLEKALASAKEAKNAGWTEELEKMVAEAKGSKKNQ